MINTNVELYILKDFFSCEEFQKYRGFIDWEFLRETSSELHILFKCVELFHDKFPEKNIDSANTLRTYFNSQYPAKKGNDVEALFDKIDGIESDPDIAKEYLEEHRRRSKAARLAILGLEVSDGKKPFEELIAAAQGLSEMVGIGEDTEFVSDDFETLQAKMNEPGLPWRLTSMNMMLGPLRKGDFGFIFARPESGKTTFLADQVSFMAEAAVDDGPILWFNNEEQGSKVLLRCIQATCNVDTKELLPQLGDLRQTFNEKTRGRIKIYDAASIHRRDVDRICDRYKPILILFDQIDKIKGFDGDDRNDLALKALYQWARELAKKYGPVIGVCQAGATGEGKRYLTMDDVDSSKTSKQGEADWILGIGKANQDGMEGIRHLHLCKNKLLGSETTIPELRHGKRDIRIFPERARYEDV